MWNWSHAIISGDIHQHLNPDLNLLVEKALKSGKAHLDPSGALQISSGPPTQILKVVSDEFTKAEIDWNRKLQPIEAETFSGLIQTVLKKIHLLKPELYLLEGSAGANASFSVGFRFITPSAVHCLFTKILLREKEPYHPLGEFTIYHDPEGPQAEIAINFRTKEAVVCGSSSCADLERIFSSIVSTIFVDQGILIVKGRIIKDSGKLSFYFEDGSCGSKFALSPEGLFLVYGGYFRRSIDSPTFGCLLENNEFLVCKERFLQDTYPFPDEMISLTPSTFKGDSTLLRKASDYSNLLSFLLENTRSTYVVSHKEDPHLYRPH